MPDGAEHEPRRGRNTRQHVTRSRRPRGGDRHRRQRARRRRRRSPSSRQRDQRRDRRIRIGPRGAHLERVPDPGTQRHHAVRLLALIGARPLPAFAIRTSASRSRTVSIDARRRAGVQADLVPHRERRRRVRSDDRFAPRRPPAPRPARRAARPSSPALRAPRPPPPRATLRRAPRPPPRPSPRPAAPRSSSPRPRRPSSISIANSVLISALPRSISTSTPSGDIARSIAARTRSASVPSTPGSLHPARGLERQLLAAHLAREADHAFGQRLAVGDDDDPDHCASLLPVQPVRAVQVVDRVHRRSLGGGRDLPATGLAVADDGRSLPTRRPARTGRRRPPSRSRTSRP